MPINAKILIAVVSVLALIAGYLMSSMLQEGIDESSLIEKEKALADARKHYSPVQGHILSPARKITVPALSKDNGETFTLGCLTGQWNLLFFGYTHCPDVCPTTMATLAQAKKIATTNNHIFPKVVFISVDPERDKVEMLGKYVRYYDNDFIGVTGDNALIKELALQMSVIYLKAPVEEGSDPNAYLVDHSASLMLLNPEGKLVAFFKAPHNANNILKDFQTMVNKSH